MKHSTNHVLVDHGSYIPNGKEAIGVDDETPDAALFKVDVVPSWAFDIIQVLTKGAVFLKHRSRA